MSIKKQFYKLETEEFNQYLDSLKKSPNTLHFMNDKYFYSPDMEIFKEVLVTHALIIEFNNIYYSLASYARDFLNVSYLINEIESTNKVENIILNENVIYYELVSNSNNKDPYIKSIIETYKLLLDGSLKIQNHQDIRNIYNKLVYDSLALDDIPDGQYYRCGSVSISDGMKVIHQGVPNQDINKLMEEFINIYNDESIEVVERAILSHFLLETIHPYYDGNGRLGRYLLVNSLYTFNKSISSLLISKIILDNKSKYYKAFKDARDVHSFGCLNDFVLSMIKTINKGLKDTIDDLKKKRNSKTPTIESLSIFESSIYTLLKDATVFSHFGVSNNEIMKTLNVSRRTLMYALKKFKSMNLLKDTKIGANTYHKLKNIQ